MTIYEVTKQIQSLELEIMTKKKQLAELRKEQSLQIVENYMFQTVDHYTITLKELFKDKNQLIIIHNMGSTCRYCSMWADGFNGIYHHLLPSCEFVLSSPDDPIVQEDFAASKGWSFPMVSSKESTFSEDLGFKNEQGFMPGVSTFTKDTEGTIFHHHSAFFGPHDEYCVTYSLLDLLPSGSEDFVPQLKRSNSSFQLTNNVAVGVKNYENALQFYSTILGMKAVSQGETETKFSMNGVNFFIENSDKNTVHFEFAVDDFQSSKQKLLDSGCTVDKTHSSKSEMISDPYGLKFHLYEIKKG
ncbi:DUF899 family protein [Rossellomorea aquimaris]|uniref:DUF899 family protein n=1 Tax=Rossellomorea aquimaris TaxID=189382 RepID=UPI0007D07A6E|nr:DUF899 family protein [Rossellomorea aquimaris]